MFCENCGTENDNSAKFCRGCGKPLTGGSQGKKTILPENDQNREAQRGAAPMFDQKAGQAAEKIKQIPKGALIGAGVGIVALIAVIGIAVSGGKTIHMDKYLTVETTGYDGYGRASVSIDWDAIEEKYGKKLTFTNAARKEYGGFTKMMSPVDVIQEHVSVELDTYSGLSNGDEIAYAWEVDEEISDLVKCKVKYKDSSISVSRLEEIGTFDGFAGLEVEFTGIAPNGKANLNYTGSDMNYSDFQCDKTSGLSNGDTVTVTIDEDRIESYAEQFGKVPEILEKEYQVQGLESYLAKLDEIDDASLASMQQQASDEYNAYAAKNWGEGEILESFTYLGDYLLTAKEGNDNYLFLVYKARVKNYYSYEGRTYDQPNDIYWYIRFEDLMVGADGSTLVDLNDYKTPNDRITIETGISSSWFSTKKWYYYGYQTLADLYKNVVTANLNAYNHQDNVNEGAAPQAAPAAAPAPAQGAAASESAAAAMNGTGWIFANSGTELLTRANLEGLTAEQCKIARNEIYARHGRKFNDAALQAHFDACPWYQGTIEANAFKESDLNEVELANRDLIVAYETEMGYR